MSETLPRHLQTADPGEACPSRLHAQRVAFALTILALLVAITALHYFTNTHLFPYHTIYRSLYFLPIGMAAVIWGLRGGLIVSVIATLLHLPYLLFFEMRTSTSLVDNVLELILFNGAALVIGLLADLGHRERRQALVMRSYVDGVLASLPIGVITRARDGAAWLSQNQVARELLGPAPWDLPLPIVDGYQEAEWHHRPLSFRHTQLLGPRQTAIGEVITVEDLSESRRLAQQVAQAERQAALGRLAGGLAHEVRNPLGIVRATTQLLAARLQEGTGGTRYAQYTQVLTQEADRIDRLIGELLAYAQPRALARQEIALSAFLTSLMASCQPYAEQSKVVLSLVSPPNASLSVMADPEYLRQAVLNLVLNAIQATPGGSNVEVTYQCIAQQACILVRDEGPGIPPGNRNRIFDPFFTTREEGTGMGLSVVARIVADHAGTIELDDAPGGGTLARLCLPAVPSPKESEK
jgi:signal transduction histidine kinase